MSRVEAVEVRKYATPLQVEGVTNRTLRALAATYGRVYDVGLFTETLHPGVFTKSIRESARALPLHLNHTHDNIPIGKVTEWQDTDAELRVLAEFDTRAEAMEAARLAEQGYLSGVSVGFLPLAERSRWDTTGAKPHVDRYEARMLEMSLCSVPAYDDAAVVAVRSLGVPDLPATVVRPTPHLDGAKAWLASIRS